MAGTLHEDICTFMISRLVILGMRTVSGKILEKNQNTFYVQ